MNAFTRFLFFFAIVLAGLWLGLKWGAHDSKVQTTPTIPSPIVERTQVVPVVIPSENVVTLEDDTIVETGTETPSTETSSNTEDSTVSETTSSSDDSSSEEKPTPSLPTRASENVIPYSNASYGYGFDIPANVYYAAFGPQNGARHTIGIGKDDPETFDDAAVKVYYYGKQVLPELQNAHDNKVEDPEGKYVYLLLDGSYSVKIEATDINNPVVQKIIQTIHVTSN